MSVHPASHHRLSGAPCSPGLQSQWFQLIFKAVLANLLSSYTCDVSFRFRPLLPSNLNLIAGRCSEILQHRSEVGPYLAVVHVAHDSNDCRAGLGVLVAVCTATAPVTGMQLACMSCACIGGACIRCAPGAVGMQLCSKMPDCMPTAPGRRPASGGSVNWRHANHHD